MPLLQNIQIWITVRRQRVFHITPTLPPPKKSSTYRNRPKKPSTLLMLQGTVSLWQEYHYEETNQVKVKDTTNTYKLLPYDNCTMKAHRTGQGIGALSRFTGRTELNWHVLKRHRRRRKNKANWKKYCSSPVIFRGRTPQKRPEHDAIQIGVSLQLINWWSFGFCTM